MPKVVNDAHALPAFDDFESEVLDGQLSGITEELPIFFTSVEEYISKFYSLLLQEARHDVASAYESAVVEGNQLCVNVLRTWVENRCKFFECSAETNASLIEGTVVIFSEVQLLCQSRSIGADFALAAVVTHIQPNRSTFEARLMNIAQVRIGAALIPKTEQSSCGRIAPKSKLWMIPTCRLSSHLRCRDALSVLHDAAMGFQNFLVSPSACKSCPLNSDTVLRSVGLTGTSFLSALQDKLNIPQFESLINCLPSFFHSLIYGRESVVPTNYFTLIQGPPGTGKTKVIVSLTNVLHLLYFQQYFKELDSFVQCERADERLQKRKRSTTRTTELHKLKPRILICAPNGWFSI